MMDENLDRLNYFNGQRLKATDFRLEQAYHMTVQRWLNKSLFSAGVAAGFDIERVAADRIIVHPGLALDDLGREIILLEPRELAVEAPLLTIRYDEEKIAPVEDGCEVPAGKGKKEKVTWGGPSIIRAEPILDWRTRFPQNDQRELVIAEFELDEHCKIKKILNGPFRYATVSSVSRVRTYALQGALDIDKNNPGQVDFHIHDRRPEAVKLYIRTAEFPSLYYTELGHHEHSKTLTGTQGTDVATHIDAHTHGVGDAVNGLTIEYGELPDPDRDFDTETRYGYHTGKHSTWAVVDPSPDPHQANWWDFLDPTKIIDDLINAINGTTPYRPNPVDPAYSLRVITRTKDPLNWVELEGAVGLKIFRGQHHHKIVGKTGPFEHDVNIPLHKHDLGVGLTLDPAGVSSTDPRHSGRTNQPPLTYIRNLKIFIDKHDYTTQILEQIRAQYNGDPADWATLGSDSPSHPLVTDGSGPIRLDFLLNPPLNLSEESHLIEFRVDQANVGGRLYYNLYVE